MLKRFRDESLWSEEFLDFVRECLVKNYEERPASFELQGFDCRSVPTNCGSKMLSINFFSEHEFFLKVPANPSKIKAKLVDRLWALKGKAKKGAPEITPTVRKGISALLSIDLVSYLILITNHFSPPRLAFLVITSTESQRTSSFNINSQFTLSRHRRNKITNLYILHTF